MKLFSLIRRFLSWLGLARPLTSHANKITLRDLKPASLSDRGMWIYGKSFTTWRGYRLGDRRLPGHNGARAMARRVRQAQKLGRACV